MDATSRWPTPPSRAIAAHWQNGRRSAWTALSNVTQDIEQDKTMRWPMPPQWLLLRDDKHLAGGLRNCGGKDTHCLTTNIPAETAGGVER